MSVMYTSFYCNKIISQIKSNEIKTYEEVLAACSRFGGTFWRQGLADMCWDLKRVNFDYARSRMLVREYDYRFTNVDLWKNFSDEEKPKIAELMQDFESKTNLLCGIQYQFNLGKDLDLADYDFISPYIYFLPAVDKGECCLEMINLIGDKIFFSTDKTSPDYGKKVREWKFGGKYSLNKFICAINDKRLIFNLDNEILVKSDYEYYKEADQACRSDWNGFMYKDLKIL